MTGREQYFIDNYTGALRNFTQQVIAGGLIAELPKYLIESLAIGGILGITLYIVGVKQTMQEVIPVATRRALVTNREEV